MTKITHTGHPTRRLDLDLPKKHLYRPLALKFLTLAGLILACWNGIRLVQGILAWTNLQTYSLVVGAWYIAISGGTWTIINILTSWGLWFEKAWAWLVAMIGIVGYAGWLWIDRLVFQFSHSNWPFALIATFLLTTLAIILLLTPGVRYIFLKGSNERKS